MKNIKTKEFTFCGHCGSTCHMGGIGFICMRCSFSFPLDRHPTKEELLFAKYEKNISELTKKYREELNHLRAEQNVVST